ncbi:LOW QUALITY PROTEIN: TAFII55_N domain-containing protein, partial [Cephalotus follicularis]
RGGALVISNDRFPTSLLDLPAIVESFKTYDDSALVKTADIGQMIMVGESDIVADVMEYRHGLPPLRDARKRRFLREPDLNVLTCSRLRKALL